MPILSVIAQLRTTDLTRSIRFYTTTLGFTVKFQYEDFYAGICAGDQVFHLKQVDERDGSIEVVDRGDHFHLYLQTDDADGFADALRHKGVLFLQDVHDTEWGTREFVIKDDQGTRCTSASRDREQRAECGRSTPSSMVRLHASRSLTRRHKTIAQA